jgi:hypothetical protein
MNTIVNNKEPGQVQPKSEKKPSNPLFTKYYESKTKKKVRRKISNESRKRNRR